MDRVAYLRIAQAVGEAQTSKIKWTRNLRISQNLVAAKRADFCCCCCCCCSYSLLRSVCALQLQISRMGWWKLTLVAVFGGRSYSSIRPGTNLWVATKQCMMRRSHRVRWRVSCGCRLSFWAAFIRWWACGNVYVQVALADFRQHAHV